MDKAIFRATRLSRRKSLNIKKEYAVELDRKCAEVDAHGFLHYISMPNAYDVRIIDLLSQIQEVIRPNSFYYDGDLELSQKAICGYVYSFFAKYLPHKAKEAKKILNQKHPYFIDAQGKSHIYFSYVPSSDSRTSSVGHSGRNPYLEFKVYIHNSVDDLRTISHEIAHGLSSHHQHIIKLIRKNAPECEISRYTRKDFDRDCIGEIESHIMEKLFNKYSYEVGLLNEEDIQSYEIEQKNALYCEIRLIQEESAILKLLSCPVDESSLKTVVNKFEREGNGRLLSRIERMHDERKNSPYMFRYIVGRVVADQWMKKFESLESDRERSNMIVNFEKYLDKTHELSLDSACEELIGLDFASVAEDYICDRRSEQKTEFKDVISKFQK